MTKGTQTVTCICLRLAIMLIFSRVSLFPRILVKASRSNRPGRRSRGSSLGQCVCCGCFWCSVLGGDSWILLAMFGLIMGLLRVVSYFRFRLFVGVRIGKTVGLIVGLMDMILTFFPRFLKKIQVWSKSKQWRMQFLANLIDFLSSEGLAVC